MTAVSTRLIREYLKTSTLPSLQSAGWPTVRPTCQSK